MGRKKVKKRKKRIKKLAIAGLLSLAAATGVIYSIGNSKHERISASAVSEWHDHKIRKGVRLGEIVRHSPTYREIGKISYQSKLNQEGVVKDFYSSGRYDDYDLMVLGILLSQSDAAMKRMHFIHKRVYHSQNGLRDIERELNKIEKMNNDEAFSELLSMSYFMTRSNYRAGDVDVFSEDLEERMKNGEGDCETNSTMTFFNFLNFADVMNRKNLSEYIRLAEGFEACNITGQGHVWLEVFFNGEWRVMSCSEVSENNLLRQKFDPEQRYHERVILPRTIAKEHIKLIEYTYRFTGPQKGYTQKICVLPSELEREMRANGWKGF
jgi:hypothetical protein